ncbi:class F sortase [Kribbella deserti]|uniref:Sortase domain-bontaining protein n=1 Tax=Kribbella deserti TaxID=1926257 RepID=A0ABV6QEY4_9ACTN
MSRRKHDRPAALLGGGLIALLGVAAIGLGGYLQWGQPSPAPSGVAQSSPGDSPIPSRPAGIEPSTPMPAAPTPTSASAHTPVPTSARPPVKTTAARTAKALAPRPGIPRQLLMPSLDVSARVVPIRADGGALTPPSNPRTVGWWSAGAKPGAQNGAAVITGHTVRAGGGAFDDLEDLRPGDRLAVTTNRGPIRYVVRDVVIYRKQALAKVAAKIFSQRIPGRLMLVTCEDWNGKVYLSNTVVSADRVP